MAKKAKTVEIDPAWDPSFADHIDRQKARAALSNLTDLTRFFLSEPDPDADALGKAYRLVVDRLLAIRAEL